MATTTRARGEKYFAGGRVRNLRPGKRDGEFMADVQGTELYTVCVVLDADGIADGGCSCPLGGDCKHVYATLKALLVEHTQGAVRALSEKQPGPSSSPRSARAKPEDARPFPEQVAVALDRKLTQPEKNFLQRLTNLPLGTG